MNQNLEQYLRCYVNYLQNDWSGLLSYAEFAINNVPNSSTGKSPFEINKGFNPRMDYLSGVGEVLVDSVDSWVNQINIIHLGIELALRQSSEKQKEFANRKRREHKFKVGDWVWLSMENLRTNRPSKKLDFKRVGPFKIKKFINEVAARLELPESLRLHPVFHVSLLAPFRGPLKGQKGVRPGPIRIDGDGVPVMEVESILKSRRRKGVLEFLVKWLGYADLENSWQPLVDVMNSWELVREFYQRSPRCMKPYKRELASLGRSLEGV